MQQKKAERRRKPRSDRQEGRGAPGRAAKGAVKAHAPEKASKPSSRRQTAGSPGAAGELALEADSCRNCSRALAKDDRALFVEEEVGRIFCGEECIADFFSPEIGRLEKDYYRHLVEGDLSGEEREGLAHLRWITLQEPDEVWREKTLAGDYRYTLISEFQPGHSRVWSICICLMLRGEPSFLYLAFPTRNAAMVNHYRRGERMEWNKTKDSTRKERSSKRAHAKDLEDLGTGTTKHAGNLNHHAGRGGEAAHDEEPGQPTDRLADEWTENETFLAQMVQERGENDIPQVEYSLYQSCMEPTLETPDEVWSVVSSGKDALKRYHFIRRYCEEQPEFWFVIVARETEDDEQIEILDAFPTRDAALVNRYRCGEQEVGESSVQAQAARVVH